MTARRPEELDHLFAKGLNAGNLDALMAIYEPEAVLLPQPGQAVTGTHAIREALQAFVGMKPTITLDVEALAQTHDIALTSARWELSGTGPDGKPMKTSGRSIEVSRRQPDGTWRFVIDNPWGLAENGS
jgi:uncharacterized protein (TIGR02246 family)